MKAEIKRLPQSEIEMFFELDPKEWGEFINEAVKDLAREIKIDGFRPGHAPQKLVEQKTGLGKILERAADLAVRRQFFEAVKENNLEPIAPPQIQILKIAADNPFIFKAKIAVAPEVKLSDYQKIAQAYPQKSSGEIKVEEDELKKSLEWLQKSRTKFVTVNRSVQKGDRVEIDFSTSHQGKEIPDGGAKNYSLILGEGWNFAPGFEEQISGLKENEEKKFSLIFPENWRQKELAGSLVDFEVKMKLVQEAQKPELDDNFARSLGNFKDLAALKTNIEEGLRAEKEQKEKDLWRLAVLQKIAEKSEAEIPEILVEAEKEKMAAELEENLAQMGLQFEKYLADIKKTKEDLKKEWSQKAKERVMAALILRAIARQEKLEIDGQELEEQLSQFLLKFSRAAEAKLSLAEAEAKIDKERLKEYLKGSLLNEKVFQLLEKFSKQAF